MVYEKEKEILELEKIIEIRKSIPLVYQLSEPFLYKKYLNENMDRLERLYNVLSDELSKETLLNVIKTRCSWNEKYVQEVKISDMYYIPELQLGSNEIFLDGGAYDGDSAKEFIKHVKGSFNKIYCVEPNVEKHDKINELALQYETGKIELIPYGISNKNEKFYFSGKEMGYCISDRGTEVSVTTVDMLEINPTFIKYDIQGEELRALIGAEKTIRKIHPKMAICVYHKYEDLLDIAEFILDLNMNYKLILRHHSDDIGDTVLYAI